jgi:hypothetical protein
MSVEGPERFAGGCLWDSRRMPLESHAALELRFR